MAAGSERRRAVALLAPVWLAVQLVVFVAWCVYDAWATWDGDPSTHSASEFIKRWVRSRPWHLLVLALAIVDGAAFLLLHLALQVV